MRKHAHFLVSLFFQQKGVKGEGVQARTCLRKHVHPLFIRISKKIIKIKNQVLWFCLFDKVWKDEDAQLCASTHELAHFLVFLIFQQKDVKGEGAQARACLRKHAHPHFSTV